MPSWTQDQAIDYECACDAIGDMIAIKAEQIEAELNSAQPNQAIIGLLRAERRELAQCRHALDISDTILIREIRRQYGAIIQAWNRQPADIAH